MYKPIVVTGLPRSGTSLVTEILHREFGYQMATTIAMPRGGNWFFDFEDLEINTKLASIYFSAKSPQIKRLLAKDLLFRYDHKRHSDRIPWGFKSPFMMFYLNELPSNYITIKTKRNELDCKASLRKNVLRVDEFNLISTVQSAAIDIYKDVKTDIVVDVDGLDFDKLKIKEFLSTQLEKLL